MVVNVVRWPEAPHRLMAVLVIYQRRREDTRSWAWLKAQLDGASDGHGLQLAHVLVYDNSPEAAFFPEQPDDRVEIARNPGNGGTAAAYRLASRRLRELGCDWLLLLDHDTALPDQFLEAATLALGHRRADALLPWVRQGARPISPARVSWTGRIVPIDRSAPGSAGGRLTAISSGLLLHADAVVHLETVPPALWLDYVDHWLLARLRASGCALRSFDATLQHELSLERPAAVDGRRMASILAGEALFVRYLPWPARALQPLRLAVRALRWLPTAPRHSLAIMRQLARVLSPLGR